MRKLMVVCILLWAGQAAAQEPARRSLQEGRLYTESRITLYGAAAFDIVTTEMVMRNGGRELNPIAGQNFARRTGVAVGTAVLADFLTNRLRRTGHPKLATVCNFVVGGIRFGAGTHNLIQSRRF